MSRIITSSILALLLIMALAAGYFYYQHYKNQDQSPENAIPADAAFFIKGPLNSAFNDLKKTVYWKSLDKSELFRDLKNNIVLFENIKNEYKEENDIFNVDDMTVSFHVTGQNTFGLLFVIPIKEVSFKKAWEILKQKSLTTPSENERKYEGQTFYELNTEADELFTYTISNNLFIGSFTSFLVEDAVRQQKVGQPFGNSESFKKVSASITSDSAKYSFYINYGNFQKFAALFTADNFKSKLADVENWSDWTGLEMQFLGNRIVANGYLNSSAPDKITSALQNQKPVPYKALEVLPANTAAFQVYSLSNLIQWHTDLRAISQTSNMLANYRKSLKQFEQQVKVPISNKFLELLKDQLTVCITEPGGKNYENNVLSFFTLKDPKKAALSLKAFSVIDNPGKKKLPIENFMKHQIANIPIDGLLPAIFGNNYIQFKNFFYTIHGDYLIIANQPSALRAYLENVANGKTLKKSDSWKDISNTWLSSFNYGFTLIFPAANSLGKIVLDNYWKSVSDERQSVLGDAKAFVYQVSSAETGLYCHSSLVFSEKRINGGTNLLWTFKPDTNLLSGYSFICSETDNYVFCQDSSLKIYLVNSDGKVVWKKQLDEKVTGQAYEVKLLENNKFQFMFTSENRIYLLDSDGNSLGNYPIKLPSSSKSGAVFNDGNFFVHCNNQQIYGYQLEGKPLQGWQFNRVDNKLQTPFSVTAAAGKSFLQAVDHSNMLMAYDMNGKLALKSKLKEGLLYNDVYANIKNDSSVVFSLADSVGSIYNYFTSGDVTVKSTSFSGTVISFIMITDEKGAAINFIYLTPGAIHLTDPDGKTLQTYEGGKNFDSMRWVAARGKKFLLVKCTDKTLLLLSDKLQPVKGFPLTGDDLYMNNDAGRILIEDGEVAKFYELN